MKYFILAGEKSGDLHGANLIREIKLIDSEAEIQAWGGDDMQAEGAEILMHHKELAIMGILGVIQNLQKLKGLFKRFGQQIDQFKPDTVIFIDYGGFNLKAARIAKTKNYYTQFYIAPKVWAWNKGRIEEIKKWVDQLYVIFPFEEKLFQQHAISTHYVGNPLKDAVNSFVPNPIPVCQKPYVALLPGSRKQEIKSALPVFNSLIQMNPSIHFVLAGVSDWENLYKDFPCTVVINQTYDVLHHAQAAIVTSGTATLETALIEIPQIVVYKTDWLFYSLAKLVIRIKYISLVNIILDYLAVPELIQTQFSAEHITAQLLPLLPENSMQRKSQLESYATLKEIIGEAGASQKTAEKIVYYTRLAR